MTRTQLSEYLGYKTTCDVSTALVKAKKARPDLFHEDIRQHNQTTVIETDFTVEECKVICEFLKRPPSPLQIELMGSYLPEAKTRHIIRKSPYVRGMKKFISTCKKYPQKKACGNCVYCVPSTRRNEDSYRMIPFCTFYNRFLGRTYLNKRGKKVQVDIFNDWCETWEKGEIKLWYINKYRDIGGNNATVRKKNED